MMEMTVYHRNDGFVRDCTELGQNLPAGFRAQAGIHHNEPVIADDHDDVRHVPANSAVHAFRYLVNLFCKVLRMRFQFRVYCRFYTAGHISLAMQTDEIRHDETGN